MAIRCYLRDTTADTTCDSGTNPTDMSTTQGSTATLEHTAVGHSSYTLIASYQIDLSGDGTVLHGSQSYDLSISVNTWQNCDFRVRLRSVDTTGCSRTNSSSYQTFTVAGDGSPGTKTFSLTLNHPTTDEHIELEVETQQQAPHGNRRVIFDVNDVNSWVDVPQVVSSDYVDEPLRRSRLTLSKRCARVSAIDLDITYDFEPTVEAYIIDPGNGPGTDYLTLNDFEVAKRQPLVANKVTMYALCRSTDGSTDFEQVTFGTGWTSNETYSLNIIGLENNYGLYESNNYVMTYSGGTNGTILFENAGSLSYVVIKNIQITKLNNTSGIRVTHTGANTYVIDSVVGRRTAGSSWAFVVASAGDHTFYISNAWAFGVGGTWGSGLNFEPGTTIYANNCLMQDCSGDGGYVISDATSTFISKNCIAENCSVGWREYGSGVHSTLSTNNVSDDGTAPGTNPILGVPQWAGDLDRHLTPDDTIARGRGVDLRSDVNTPVTEDIEGNPRPHVHGTTDIGPWQSIHPLDHTRIFGAAVTPAATAVEFELHRARRASLHRAARITAADVGLTYDPKTGRITAADIDATYDPKTGRITAADIDLTYDLKTGRITAADIDATYDPKTGRVTAADIDLTYDLKTGRVTAADLDLTYALKTGRITAADLDLTYTTTESGIEFVLARTRQLLLARVARIVAADIDLVYDLKTGRVTAADIDVTYDLKTGRITAADIDATYDLKTGRVTAADLDLTYSPKTGRVTATDIDLTYSLKAGRITAADLDLTYALKTGRITAADLDLTYETTESGIEFVLARARQALLHRQARVTALDVDITHSLKTGRITAADLDLTYALKTGRITAADLDLTYTTTASGIEFVLARTRQALLYRAGRITGLDVDLEHDLKTGRITAADLDLTYSLKTGRITAADVDVVYAAKAGRITALDIDLIHEVKTGRVTALDADIVYDLKTGRITALDADIVYFNQKGHITAMDVVITYSEQAVVDDTPVFVRQREGRLVWSQRGRIRREIQ